ITSGWTTQEWQRFLDALPRELNPQQLAALDGAFGFTRSGNSEILFSWLQIAIRQHYVPALRPLEHFLASQGRRKYLAPLYRALMAQDWGKEEAKRVYARAR